MSSTAPLITAITRTLSEIGESSASLVPETRDHRHLAQSCESLHRRNAWRFSVTARASAAPLVLNLWRNGSEARAGRLRERRRRIAPAVPALCEILYRRRRRRNCPSNSGAKISSATSETIAACGSRTTVASRSLPDDAALLRQNPAVAAALARTQPAVRLDAAITTPDRNPGRCESAWPAHRNPSACPQRMQKSPPLFGRLFYFTRSGSEAAAARTETGAATQTSISWSPGQREAPASCRHRPRRACRLPSRRRRTTR